MVPLAGALAFLALATLAHYRLSSVTLKLALLLLLGTALRAFVALQNPLILQDWPLCDDSHYYFTIARNLTHGAGLRHDSAHVTTGFQPLFLLLVAPLFELIQDKLVVINAVLILQVGIGLACALLLYRLACFVTTRAVALLAVGIWATSPFLLGADLNGLETNTSLCFLLATLCLYVRDFVVADSAGLLEFVRLGVVCGLSFLARVDLGLLIPVLSLDILFRECRRGRLSAHSVGQVFVLNVAAAVTLSPWMIFNRVVVGSVLPSSGQAVRFLSQAYGYRFIDGSDRQFPIGHPPLAYYVGTAKLAVRNVVEILRGTFPLWPAALAIGYCLATSARRFWKQQQQWLFLFSFLVLLFSSYTCYIFGQWFLTRYLTPFTVAYILVIALAVGQMASDARERSPLLRHALVGIGLAALSLSLFRSLTQVRKTLQQNSPSTFYQVALWTNQNTPRDSLIGAFQTGILGYYMDRRFCGLDGKINVDALRAMQSKSIDLYVQDQKIDYLLDWPWILDSLFTLRATDPGFLARQRLIWRGPSDVYGLSARSKL